MKTWEKPTLIVLVRSEPQEAIMTVCKTPPEIQGFGAESAFNACLRVPDDGVGCASCSQAPDS
jgi:hypothetical protein